MTDIVLISVPYTVIETPPLGIAVLKGAVESEGFQCQTLDLGMELFKFCGNDRRIFDQFQEYFMTPNFANDPQLEQMAAEFIEHWAQQLAKLDTRWLGFSVFSYYAQLATVMLCERVRKLAPDLKIVIGGAGSGVKVSHELWEKYQLTSAEKLLNYGDVLKKRGIIDACVTGDGESALIDLLHGHSVSDHFHTENYKNNSRAFANFDDFNLMDYKGQLNRGYPQLPIFSSKGCVRNCDFCDVNYVQNRFRFRQGVAIVEEMIYLADRYGIRDFVFLDSLVNGNLKSLREWVTALAEYNRNNPEKKITWSASGWICRPIGQIPAEFYAVMAESGCQSVTIGAESGSNQVLTAMDKKTTVEALYYEIEQFRKHNIKFITLLIVGHWAEHWTDFLDTARMIYRLAEYVRSGHLVSVNPGAGFNVVPNTPADLDRTANQLIHVNRTFWWTPTNPGLTAKEKYYRLLLLEQLLKYLKMPLMQEIVGILHDRLSSTDYAESVDFYKNIQSALDSTVVQQAEYYYNHFDDFVDLVTAADNLDMSATLVLESSVTNNLPPTIKILLNDSVIYCQDLDEGQHTIKLPNVSLSKENCLSIEFSNKQPGDTIVDAQGAIVKDKCVIIKEFWINGIDLVQDVEFFYNKLQYTENGQASSVKQGFWINNSSLILRFQHPWLEWYCRNSNNYAHYDLSIITQSTLPNAQTITDFGPYRQKVLELLNQYSF